MALGRESKLAKRAVKLALKLHPAPPLGRERTFAAQLARTKLLQEHPHERVQHWYLPEPHDARPLLHGLRLPQLLTWSDVAALTGIELDALAWFADQHRFNRDRRPQKLRHYHYRWLRKRSGAYRLIEAPKPRLKQAQRRILDEILSKVPLHDACHGHRIGRSVASFAREHVGRACVIKLDLCEFFNVITEARVRAIFAALGYNDTVAPLLAALCCAPTPDDVFAARSHTAQGFMQRALLRTSHLPQGAPTSPALASLAAYRLDVRLSALAARFDAHYGRYADDLAFSGDRRLIGVTPQLLTWVTTIARDEGFEVRREKTRVMPRAQRQALCGIVVNAETSVRRSEIERLEAILYNCVRTGPTAQNRAAVADFRAHLLGRVAWVAHVNPRRAERLRALFAQIDWSG
jgi:hypothetical protein